MKVGCQACIDITQNLMALDRQMERQSLSFTSDLGRQGTAPPTGVQTELPSFLAFDAALATGGKT